MLRGTQSRWLGWRVARSGDKGTVYTPLPPTPVPTRSRVTQEEGDVGIEATWAEKQGGKRPARGRPEEGPGSTQPPNGHRRAGRSGNAATALAHRMASWTEGRRRAEPRGWRDRPPELFRAGHHQHAGLSETGGDVTLKDALWGGAGTEAETEDPFRRAGTETAGSGRGCWGGQVTGPAGELLRTHGSARHTSTHWCQDAAIRKPAGLSQKRTPAQTGLSPQGRSECTQHVPQPPPSQRAVALPA